MKPAGARQGLSSSSDLISTISGNHTNLLKRTGRIGGGDSFFFATGLSHAPTSTSVCTAMLCCIVPPDARDAVLRHYDGIACSLLLLLLLLLLSS